METRLSLLVVVVVVVVLLMKRRLDFATDLRLWNCDVRWNFETENDRVVSL
jgi:hypothetical protein